MCGPLAAVLTLLVQFYLQLSLVLSKVNIKIQCTDTDAQVSLERLLMKPPGHCMGNIKEHKHKQHKQTRATSTP